VWASRPDGDFARLAHPVNPAYARRPAVQTFARRNQPGHARSAAPILLVTGAKDALIVQASVDRLARDLEAVGDSVTYRVHANDDHNTIVEAATPEIDRWVTERFAAP
jgi:predicted esterase